MPHNIRGLRRVEYEELVNRHAFEGARVELINGYVVTKVSPTGALHRALAVLIADALREVLPDNMTLLMNQPFAASDDSEPEPDIALVTKAAGICKVAHPSAAFLLIEVCHTSGHNDRIVKRRVYAEAGVPEYWIVDVDGRFIEIYSKPHNGAYADRRLALTGVIAPASLPDARIDVVALFS